MSQNEQLVKKIKDCINAVKICKKDQQKDNLMTNIEPYREDMEKLSLEEKIQILHEAIFLSKKSTINIVAKYLGLNLNDEKYVKMWTCLENCGDNSYALQIMKNNDNWAEFNNNQYFFEQVLLKGRQFYINKKEKEWYKKLQEVIVEKTDVGFWLSKEKTTGLSKISYAVLKNEQWGDLNQDVMNFQPGWLNQDFYSIVNINNNTKYLAYDRFIVNEDNIDWNNILKNNKPYPNEAKQTVRKILENFWLQQTEDGNFVFESDKVKAYVLTDMWLFNNNHLEMGIFTTEEKSTLLAKLLNDKNSIIHIKSENKPGKYLRFLLENCFQDTNIVWDKIKFQPNAYKALKLANLDKLVENLCLKSKIEQRLVMKNTLEKKHKI